MSPRVFDDPESWDLASRALPYLRSRWKRLMPGWWGLQGRIAALYFRDAPGPSLMLADLERLSLYRSQVNYAREVRRQYADHLIARDDGTTNWDQTIDGLKESKLFDPLLRVMPELTDVLIDPSRIDSRAWRDALDQFSSVHAAFLGAREEVNRVIDLNRVLEPNGKISADNLAAWLERQSKALEGSITRLNWIAGLLKPARDVTLMELPARIASIDTLLKCGTSIDRLCANLACSSEAASARDRDWSDLRRIAEWTLSFLDQHHDHPPNELIRAATTPEIREDLIHAVRANLEARTDEFLTSWENLVDRFGPDQDVSTGIQLGSSPVADLHEWVRARRLDTERIQEWVSFSETRDKMTQTGLSLLMSDLLDGSVPVEEAKNAFLARFYRAWLDEVRRDVPELGRFATDTHERDIKQFVDLDNKSIQLTYKRIRQLLLNDPDRPRASTLNAPSSSELGVLLREVNKKTRHLSLRELFAQVPTILPRLKPCLMMSPLTVSTYLNSRDIRFDVVIFDEASQVRPHDAISSIYRGRQLIVAGDQKQLPPTNFFERSEDYEDGSIEEKQDEGNLADFESILDVCCTLQLARRRLRWHYRSRREPLIAFSNRHFYGNELVTFPSVDDTDETPAVRFEYLADGRWTGGFNRVEARKVAQMVMDHVLSNPSWSLGVIAFSRRQQEAIYDELDRLRRRDGSLESFFEEERDDPFFVKNLENVQGDERDVIFLSIGYGPDENGRVSMRFGPLNRLGGERRLNVAITRARLGMTVISSMKAHDIDLTRSKAEGVRLLRAYLDFAERGAAALASEITESDERDHDSPFEQQVAEALTRRGMQVRKQVGCGGFRIDLALVDPDRPGRFVLGIECDGATYHSSATARDRDRLRQQVLESLGWRIVRIWSTDWVKDPNHQINRVVAAFHQRLSEGPGPRTPTPGSVAPEVLPDELPVMLQHDTSVPLNPPKARYQKIEAVPEREIEDMIVASLKRNGTTDEPELIKSIVKELGFKRTGGRIHAKIKDRIDHLLSAAQIARCSDNGLRLIPDSGLKLA
jgi:very-short-patch-repair endonuclease